MKSALELLQRNYKFFKDLFVSIIANSPKYPCMSMIDFAQFFQAAGLIDANLEINTINRIFIAANVTVSEAEISKEQQFKDFNPDNLMVRYEFVEALVRAAQVKYQMPKNIPKAEKKLHVALQKMLDFLAAQTEKIVFDPQPFREEQLWNKKLHLTFKKNEAPLRRVMDFYVRHNDSSDKFLNLDNMTSWFCHTDNDLGLSLHDVVQFYAHSKITNVEECNDNSPYRYNRLRFVEFIELIARVADHKFKNSEYDEADLQWKVSYVLLQLLRPEKDDPQGEVAQTTQAKVAALPRTGSESEGSEY